MEKIDHVKLNNINPNVEAKKKRRTSKAVNLNYTPEPVKTSSNAAIDVKGSQVGQKPDIMRKTHLDMFHRENRSKSSSQKNSAKNPASKPGTTNRKGKPADIKHPKDGADLARVRTGMDDVGSRTVIIGKGAVSDKAWVENIETNDMVALVRNYLNANDGVYNTPEGYQLTVFKDKKTGLAYFTFLVPRDKGKMEEISIFVHPETPDRVNLFHRQVFTSPDGK